MADQWRSQYSELDFPDSKDYPVDRSFWYEVGIWGRGESLSLNLLGRPEGAGQDMRLILPQGSVSELGRFPVVPLTQPQRSEEGMSETGCWSCPRFTWRLRAVDRK